MFWLLVQGERNYRAQPMSKERRIPAFFRLRLCFSKFDTRWIVVWVTGDGISLVSGALAQQHSAEVITYVLNFEGQF